MVTGIQFCIIPMQHKLEEENYERIHLDFTDKYFL